MLEVRITRLPFPQRIGTNTAFKIYEYPLPNKTKNPLPDDPFQANSIHLQSRPCPQDVVAAHFRSCGSEEQAAFHATFPYRK